MEGPEWDTQAHGTMLTGRGTEKTSFSDGGGEGGYIQVFQRLWVSPGDVDLLQIRRAGDLGNGRKLAGGGE